MKASPVRNCNSVADPGPVFGPRKEGNHSFPGTVPGREDARPRENVRRKDGRQGKDVEEEGEEAKERQNGQDG